MKCTYGCGKEGKHQFKNGKWCCETHWSRCPSNITNLIKHHKGKKRSMSSVRNMVNGHKNRSDMLKEKKEKKLKQKISLIGIELCYYCKGTSKYFFEASGRYCCKDHYLKCPKMKKRQSEITFAELVYTNNLCSYGCGQESSYKFKNRNYCCSARLQSCPAIRRSNAISNSIKQKGKGNAMYGKKHSRDSIRKNRLSNIEYLNSRNGQISPNYNKNACKMIDKFGKQNNYSFQHAENGGEYFIKELGYWVDGYDEENNIVIEIDEAHHFNVYGHLLEKDKMRQNEIEEFLGCKFIRIKNL